MTTLSKQYMHFICTYDKKNNTQPILQSSLKFSSDLSRGLCPKNYGWRTKFHTTNGVVILERGETYERPVD